MVGVSAPSLLGVFAPLVFFESFKIGVLNLNYVASGSRALLLPQDRVLFLATTAPNHVVVQLIVVRALIVSTRLLALLNIVPYSRLLGCCSRRWRSDCRSHFVSHLRVNFPAFQSNILQNIVASSL